MSAVTKFRGENQTSLQQWILQFESQHFVTLTKTDGNQCCYVIPSLAPLQRYLLL